MNAKSFTLKVGNFYRSREGHKVWIVAHDPSRLHPYKGYSLERGEAYYSISGLFSLHPNDQRDLIAPWGEPLYTFDRSLLPAWSNVAMAMDEGGDWFCYPAIPEFREHSNTWLSADIDNIVGYFIPPSFAPKINIHPANSLLIF